MKGKDHIKLIIITFAIIIGIIIFWVIIEYNLSLKSLSIKEINISEKKMSENENVFEEYNLSNMNFEELNYNQEINDSFSHLGIIHFSHMPLIYSIDYHCSYERTKNIEEAMKLIEEASENSVKFEEKKDENQSVDINFICENKPSGKTNREFEHLGQATYYLNAKNELIIENETIVFYPTLTSCGYYPFTEVHEILHGFGYKHSDKKYSIMYYTNEYCLSWYENEDVYGKVGIDKDIALDLKYNYMINEEELL